MCPRFESGWGRPVSRLVSANSRFPDRHPEHSRTGAIPHRFRSRGPTALQDMSGVLSHGEFQHCRVPLKDLDACTYHREPVSLSLGPLGGFHQLAQHLCFGMPPNEERPPVVVEDIKD